MAGIRGSVIEWLGGHELTVLVGLFIVVAGTWGFIALADQVTEGETQALDEKILLALRNDDAGKTPLGPHWVSEIGRDITALGGVAVLTLVTTAVAVFLRLNGKTATMQFVLAAVIGGFVLSMGLKSLFDRDRPDIVPHLSQAHTSSFPSGHSMMSAVVYLTLGVLLTTTVNEQRLKFYFLAVPIFLTGAVGVSRVYMGVHYPTDVLAGWSAGLVWSTACWLVARRLQRQGAIEWPNGQDAAKGARQ